MPDYIKKNLIPTEIQGFVDINTTNLRKWLISNAGASFFECGFKERHIIKYDIMKNDLKKTRIQPAKKGYPYF